MVGFVNGVDHIVEKEDGLLGTAGAHFYVVVGIDQVRGVEDERVVHNSGGIRIGNVLVLVVEDVIDQEAEVHIGRGAGDEVGDDEVHVDRRARE